MMDFLNVIKEAVQTAYYTLGYLWAYAFSIAWVFILSTTFQALFQRIEVGEYVTSSKAWKRFCGAIVLGVFSSPQRKILADNISGLIGSSKALLPLTIYLVAGCNLTIYYWLLLGPLLGKEFVVANILAAVFFLSVTCPMVLLIDSTGIAKSGLRSRGYSSEARSFLPRRFLKIFVGELTKVGPWVLWGSFLGGLIAVWGLSSWWFDLAQIGGTKTLSQLFNAVIGLSFAITTFSMPVANLFVATYLWKTGMAFSGFIAYLYGGFLSPLLWPVYIESMGKKRAFYLLCILAVGVIAASLGVAAFWKLAGWTIHYKLSPNQLL